MVVCLRMSRGIAVRAQGKRGTPGEFCRAWASERADRGGASPAGVGVYHSTSETSWITGVHDTMRYLMIQ